MPKDYFISCYIRWIRCYSEKKVIKIVLFLERNLILKRNWNPNITLGDYAPTERQLKMGDLIGNRFSLALRFINVEDDSQIEKSIFNS